MIISKKFTLECAHQLPHSTPEECETYGKCSRLHGHSYKVHLKVRGDTCADGWVLNFSTVSDWAKENIENKCDHYFLNDVYPDMITTAENLATLWGKMLQEWLNSTYPDRKLYVQEVEVWETEKCRAIATQEDITPPSTNV